MENRVPKKRGRRPKPKGDEPVKPKTIKEQPEQITKKEISIKDKEVRAAKRKLKIKNIQQKIDEYDEWMFSNEALEKMHDRIMELRYPNYRMREQISGKMNTEIYRKVIEGKATELEKNEWSDITNDAAEKLCAIVDHILTSGPLTESEVDLLDRSIYLLKLYYISRVKTFIKNNVPVKYFYRMTYVPDSETYAYKIFIGDMIDMPLNTFICKTE